MSPFLYGARKDIIIFIFLFLFSINTRFPLSAISPTTSTSPSSCKLSLRNYSSLTYLQIRRRNHQSNLFFSKQSKKSQFLQYHRRRIFYSVCRATRRLPRSDFFSTTPSTFFPDGPRRSKILYIPFVTPSTAARRKQRAKKIWPPVVIRLRAR